MTPVTSQLGSFILKRTFSPGWILREGVWSNTGEPSSLAGASMLLGGAGWTDSELSLLPPRMCRRVMPCRIRRISSTLCRPSGGLGFFSRM